MAELINAPAKRVAFDPAYDNITALEYSDSIEDYKNVAYVSAKSGAQGGDADEYVRVTYDPDGATGYARFEAAVSGKRINGGDYAPTFGTQGRIALKSRRRAQGMSGIADARATMFVWEVDFDIGDIVLMRSTPWRVEKPGRITELTESWDAGVYEARLTCGDALPTVSTKIKWFLNNNVLSGQG